MNIDHAVPQVRLPSHQVKVCEAIIEQYGTSYTDVAEVISSHRRAVGARLAAVAVPNAHRVFKLSGAISLDFHWPDSDRSDDPRAVLEAEGVRFDNLERADGNQRMRPSEIARAVGLGLDVETDGTTA